MADVCEQWLGTDKGVKVTYNQHLTWLKYVFNVILVIVYATTMRTLNGSLAYA